MKWWLKSPWRAGQRKEASDVLWNLASLTDISDGDFEQFYSPVYCIKTVLGFPSYVALCSFVLVNSKQLLHKTIKGQSVFSFAC